MKYLCTNKSHHASRRKTSEPGWDVSYIIVQTCPVVGKVNSCNNRTNIPKRARMITGHSRPIR